MDRLFGFPIVKYKVPPLEYKKAELTSTILENYNIDKERNTWDTHSYLHQNIADEYNTKFKIPDCSSLEPIYLKMSQQYVKSLNLNNKISTLGNIHLIFCSIDDISLSSFPIYKIDLLEF